MRHHAVRRMLMSEASAFIDGAMGETGRRENR
jgi:hypothetical protein